MGYISKYRPSHFGSRYKSWWCVRATTLFLHFDSRHALFSIYFFKKNKLALESWAVLWPGIWPLLWTCDVINFRGQKILARARIFGARRQVWRGRAKWSNNLPKSKFYKNHQTKIAALPDSPLPIYVVGAGPDCGPKLGFWCVGGVFLARRPCFETFQGDQFAVLWIC